MIPRATEVLSTDPNGATFRHADGSERYFRGPEALALANDLEAKRAAQSLEAAPAQPTDTSRWVAGPGGGEIPTYQMSGEGFKQAPAPPPPAPPQPTTIGEALQQRLARQLMQPSAPQLKPGGQRIVAEGMPVPKTITEEREGGLPPEVQPVAMKGLGEWGAIQSAAQEEQLAVTRERIEQAKAQQMQADLIQQKLAPQIAMQRMKQAAIRGEMNTRRQQLEEQLQEAQSQRVNPDQFFEKRGVGAQIAAVIGIALSGMRPGPNIAWSMIQHQIDADINAQEKAIQLGIAGKQSALARFREQYDGDMDLAKSALAASMEASAKAEAMRMVAGEQQLAAREKLAAWMAATADKNTDFVAKYLQLVMGKATQKVENQWQKAQDTWTGGGMGGPAETVKRMEYGEQAGILGIPGPAENVSRAKAAGEAQGAPAGDTPEAVAKRADEYLTNVQKNSQAQNAVSKAATKMGLVQDKSGKWTLPEGKTGWALKGAGPIQSRIPLTPTALIVEQDFEDMIAGYAKTMSGLTVTDQQMARLRKNLKGRVHTPAEIINGINIVQGLVKADQDAAAAKAGAPALEQAQQRAFGAKAWQKQQELPPAQPIPEGFTVK